MGNFASINEFFYMGGHGLYVWLSYSIALTVVIYNIISMWLKKRRFFNQAKRRLRRERSSV